MNLINDPWIPVRRADGGPPARIAPWQLTGNWADNPILAVTSPRPDFDGALTQFLIGLLQTTCTPDIATWRKWRREPPNPAELKQHFSGVAPYFELEGEKAFMQDYSPTELDKVFPIAALLVGAPPEDSETDLFIKQGSVEQLCPHCAAAALFSIQTDSPEGGRGYRTGLRGGGPLTTLVLGETLWQTCWLNILEKTAYLADGNNLEEVEPALRFPWLGKTRTSEGKPPEGVTTPLDVHPDQQFWALPRRIRLVKTSDQSRHCDVCGERSAELFRQFKTKNHGVNYQGFEHPLSPHYLKDGQRLPVHPRPGGIGYRHWLGLVESSEDHIPARTVQQFRKRLRRDGMLWAFGYDMKSNKARCWYDARMPILMLPEELEIGFRDIVAKLVLAADKVADDLRSQIKAALFGDGSVRGDLSFVQADFWSETETAFYSHLRKLREALPSDPLAQTLLESWLKTLRQAAFKVFDRHSQTGDFDAVAPRRIALARNNLGKALAGAPLREKILGLPKPTKTHKGKKALASQPIQLSLIEGGSSE